MGEVPSLARTPTVVGWWWGLGDHGYCRCLRKERGSSGNVCVKGARLKHGGSRESRVDSERDWGGSSMEDSSAACVVGSGVEA